MKDKIIDFEFLNSSNFDILPLNNKNYFVTKNTT